jgi:hypothetical protein
MIVHIQDFSPCFLAKVEKCILNYNFMIMLKTIQNAVCMLCIYEVPLTINLVPV